MVQQPLYEFGGSGPVIHLAVANGFPPQTYEALVTPLTASYRVLSLPPRALWHGIGPPPAEIGTWRQLADDLLAGLERYKLREVIAIGHSFGAIASMLAVLDQPQRFRALVMLDPTMLTPGLLQAVKDLRAQGGVPHYSLVDGALKRRHSFADLDEAYDYWREKPLFHDWPDETLRRYTESMTRPAAAGLELAWSREWEAYYYQSIYPDSWADLPRLNGLLPILVIRAANSEAYLPEAAAETQRLLPDAAHLTLYGYGHLFPQAAPDATRNLISDWLQSLAGSPSH